MQGNKNNRKQGIRGSSGSREIRHSAFDISHKKDPVNRIIGGKPTGTPPKERK